MIESKNIKDETLKALLQLENSLEVFYPCGSRYFGTAKIVSDFDFIFESKEADQFIVNNGFSLMSDPVVCHDYLDCNTLSIYQKGEVQVIKVKSVEKRKALQNYIIENKIKIPKEDIHFWNSLYEKLEKGELNTK